MLLVYRIRRKKYRDCELGKYALELEYEVASVLKPMFERKRLLDAVGPHRSIEAGREATLLPASRRKHCEDDMV